MGANIKHFHPGHPHRVRPSMEQPRGLRQQVEHRTYHKLDVDASGRDHCGEHLGRADRRIGSVEHSVRQRRHVPVRRDRNDVLATA